MSEANGSYVRRSIADFDQYQLMKENGLCQLNVAIGGQTWQIAVEAVELDEEFTMSLLESNAAMMPSHSAVASAPPEYSSQEERKSRLGRLPKNSNAKPRSPPHSASKASSTHKKSHLDLLHASGARSQPSSPLPYRIGSSNDGSSPKQNGLKRKADAMYDIKDEILSCSGTQAFKPNHTLPISKNPSSDQRKTAAARANTSSDPMLKPIQGAALVAPVASIASKTPWQPLTAMRTASQPSHRPREMCSSEESEVDSDLERRRKQKIRRELLKLGVVVGQP